MNQQELIENVWALTEAIELAVSKEDWEHAAGLAEARSPMLMSLKAKQPAEALAIIHKIQTNINAVVERAQSAQTSFAVAYRRSMDAANAAGRYHQAARL